MENHARVLCVSGTSCPSVSRKLINYLFNKCTAQEGTKWYLVKMRGHWFFKKYVQIVYQKCVCYSENLRCAFLLDVEILGSHKMDHHWKQFCDHYKSAL